MNRELFKYFMAKNQDTMKVIANVLGMHEITLYKKLNGVGDNELDRGEIAILARRWKLTREDFIEIFFADIMA